MTELDSLLILNAIPGLGNNRIKKLIERFGSPGRVLTLQLKDFTGQGTTGQEIVDRISRFPRDSFLETEYPLMNKHNVKIITCKDKDYPELLKEIPDAPLVLYWKGDIGQIDPLSMAIVGSRQASIYGLTMAERIAKELAELGITIISGMARGIDTAAHQGAFKAGGFSFAVLGCGLAHSYVSRNRKLYSQMAESGAMISEFAMQTQPSPFNFPRRNRIISGLSLGVIVVEAFKRSGALITSRLAAEQGREVFAFPGNVNHPNAQGTNSLIQQGVKLISCVEDVLEELKPRFRELLRPRQSFEEHGQAEAALANLSKKEDDVYQILTNNPIHIDMLANQCSISLLNLSSIILGLELKGLLKQLPGQYYVKT